MQKNLLYLIILILSIGCQDTTTDPFENIDYVIFGNHSFSERRPNFYLEDTVYVKIYFSDTLSSIKSAYFYNTFEPDKTFEIQISDRIISSSIKYPIDINYKYDSVNLVAIFISATHQEIPLIKEKVTSLYTTQNEKVYNIASDLSNGYYSVFYNSYNIESRFIDKLAFSKEGYNALDVFIMNFNSEYKEDLNFRHSLTSYTKTDINPNAVEGMNGSKFLKIESASLDDFKTPAQIINSFESNSQNATIKITNLSVGDLYAVRIIDCSVCFFYNIAGDSIALSKFIPEYELQYGILEIAAIQDDFKSSKDGGTDNDYIEFRLLTFTPPRSNPIILEKKWRRYPLSRIAK